MSGVMIARIRGSIPKDILTLLQDDKRKELVKRFEEIGYQ
ncbi:MAG: hypothetical protein JETT_2628 [Candidatus Jettenia ecosi]|uniref:Uncharacterized protein n=1 Tax=Candidatus Jettenia ecosi TaxID=2494326 RepID=A0A533Q8U5_9BACT|nr:MAG: hypothetical protein JETT_2628 [Candidatus Jettenia ecosi]